MTFAEAVAAYTAEYIAREGFVTCEFGTGSVDWDAKLAVLRDASAALPEGSRWVINTCETCVENHGPDTFHTSIESVRFAPIGSNDLFDAAVPA